MSDSESKEDSLILSDDKSFIQDDVENSLALSKYVDYNPYYDYDDYHHDWD